MRSENDIKTEFKEICYYDQEIDRTGPGSCPVVDFAIIGVKFAVQFTFKF
jgi:hypothetical protein